MATFYIPTDLSGGTIQVNDGDIFIFEGNASSNVAFESATGLPTDFSIQFNASNSSLSRVEIKDDLNVDIEIADNVVLGSLEIKATKALSTNVTIGDNVTLDKFQGSPGTDTVVIGDNFITNNDFKTDDGDDYVLVGENFDANNKIDTGGGNDTVATNDPNADIANAETVLNPDGTVTGTSGNDTMGVGFVDGQGDEIDGLDGDDDIIMGNGGDDTIDAGAGNDTVDGGQGADSILGGDGADVIHGDNYTPTTLGTTTYSWAGQGVADETSITGGLTGNSADGDIQVTTSIVQEENFVGASMETNDALYNYNGLSDTSSIELYGGSTNSGQNASTMTMDFSSNNPTNVSGEVADVTFGIFDLDESVGQFLDQVIITAFDADGNPVAVILTAGNSSTISVDAATGTATAIGDSSGGGSVTSLSGFLKVTVAGPVSQIVIDYNNVDTAYGNHAIRVGDLEFTTLSLSDPTLDGDTIDGGAGNDEIFGDQGDDSLTGGADNDTVYGGDGADSVSGGAGADSLFGGAGNDAMFGGAGADSVSGGDGDDTVTLGDGNDTFGDFSTEAGNDTVYGGAGSDSINGGSGDDELYGGTGNDTLTGATGNDTIYGGEGNDTFLITDNHEGDIIVGGEDGDGSDVDELSFSNFESTDGVTVTATGAEAGTYDFDGTVGTGSYSEIEALNGTSYDDTFNLAADNSGVSVDANGGDDIITSGGGADIIGAGSGADTVNAGAGNDTINLNLGSGAGDGDADVVVLQDGSGNDTISDFDAPTANGDGTFTGIDTLDVSGLNDAGGDPVNVWDVTVTNDGFGNALLTFPNGESVVLEGIDPANADDPFYLNAIGIPLSDGTVEGTSGADTIEAGYTGDPDGDMVDNGDAILPGDTGDDDLIYAYGGNDTINSGLGDDEVYGGADNDTINSGAGDDTSFGGTGDDTFNVASNNGSDAITGGEDVGDGDVDTLNFADSTGPDGVAVTMSGDEAGTYSFTSETGTGTFDEIEQINLTDQNDTFDGVLATGGNTVDGGAGDDSLTGSSGSDSFDGGAGADTLVGGAGDDTLTGGDGADIITGGADQDVIYGGAGDVIDGSETGVDNDTLIVSGVDYIDYDSGNSENGTVFFEGGGSLTFTNIENVIVSDRDGTVSGTVGDDLIDAGYIGDPDGDAVDNNDAILVGDSGNDDLIEAGAGNDSILAGAGNDEVYGGTGNDVIFGGVGDDTLFGEDGNDIFELTEASGSDVVVGGEDVSGTDIDRLDFDATIGGTGADVVFTGDEAGSYTVGGTANGTFTGIEGIEGTNFDDTIDASASSADQIVVSLAGEDDVKGGSGDDIILTGDGNDTLAGGQGADDLAGEAGDDTFVLENNFGNDVITGGETGETFGDILDASSVTDNLTVDLRTLSPTDPEAGTITDGTGTAAFSEVEMVILGSGDDSVIGSSGNDTIATNSGSDTVNLGAGDDTLDLGLDGGGSDGEADVIVLQDGSGNDLIMNFDAPTPDGDGTFTGIDTLDVTNLNDAGGDPVNTNDVTVTDDGTGNAVLTFPNGESITLLGIDPIVADDPFYLNAMGIPLPDGTVSGTVGDDTIDAAYTGDPDGDMVDNGDAILAGDTGNDDLIEAGAGNDSINAGSGNDEVYGGTGNDYVVAGTGNDTVFGGANDDVLYGVSGTDTLYGGTGDDIINGGTDADSIFGGDDDDSIVLLANYGSDIIEGGEGGTDQDEIWSTQDVNVSIIATGSEAGAIFDGTSTATFTQIEELRTEGGNDTIVLTNDASGMAVSAGAGTDTIIGGSGDDLIQGDAGEDSISGGLGADTLEGGTGNDTITFADGDTVDGGTGDDLFVLEDLGEAANGTITVNGGAGDEIGGDTLQLGSLANLTQAVRDTFVDDGTGSFSGSVTLDDGTILNFSEIENIICFTPNTRIATPKGLVAVKDLKVGDLVVTRDHGLQPIRWIEGRTVPAVDRFAPVRISKNVLSGQERDLIVSPQHRVLFQGYRAELLFGESEVLVAAKHLVDGLDVTQDEAELVTYVHMMFDQHEIIYAEGAATESFHPGDIGFNAVTDKAREELFAIFPELRADQAHYGATARRCLKRHEAKLLHI